MRAWRNGSKGHFRGQTLLRRAPASLPDKEIVEVVIATRPKSQPIDEFLILPME
jgi:hypothetical protein